MTLFKEKTVAVSEESLVEVLPAHQLDNDKLKAYLQCFFARTFSTFRVRQFQGGQSNPTYLIEADDSLWVLRKKPSGKLLPSAHMVEREYRVMRALGVTEVPVPHMHFLCEDESILGTPFYLMDFIPGLIEAQPDLPSLTPEQRRQVYHAMAKTMASIHRVSVNDIGLEDFGKRQQDFFARQIDRWSTQYQNSAQVPAGGEEGAKAMRILMQWLPAHIPQDSQVSLVHGDFRIGNLILDPTSYDVAATLDWELSTLGHPLADLAYCCIPYHLNKSNAGIKGLIGLDLHALGIPSEQEFIADYCRHAGRDNIENWSFYLAFSLFRLAAILQGVYARALQGNASSANALAVGERAAVLATTAVKLIHP